MDIFGRLDPIEIEFCVSTAIRHRNDGGRDSILNHLEMASLHELVVCILPEEQTNQARLEVLRALERGGETELVDYRILRYFYQNPQSKNDAIGWLRQIVQHYQQL